MVVIRLVIIVDYQIDFRVGTNHLYILQLENQPTEQLRERLIEAIDDWIGTTSITLEEQTRATITKLGQTSKDLTLRNEGVSLR